MPLKYTNRANALTILWTSQDATRTASFQIPKQGTDKEQVEALVKALGFLVSQTGATVPTPGSAVPARSVSPSGATPAPSAASPAHQVPMMPPASLSDRPSDGGRPQNFEFWESMPTMAIPQALAQEPGGGWEMIPPGEA